jgi:hypothetical protein
MSYKIKKSSSMETKEDFSKKYLSNLILLCDLLAA